LQNKLYIGDNLKVMRDKMTEKSVDLVYLDPPFNSERNYNMLGGTGDSVERAFNDTWKWDKVAVDGYDYLTTSPQLPIEVKNVMEGLFTVLGGSSMMAYLVFMALRLVEIKRVMKDTASIYVHCNHFASHYIKVVLDAIFGRKNFKNNIVWCYTAPSGVTGMYPRKHDDLFFYTKSDKYYFQLPRIPHRSGIHNNGRTWNADYNDPERVRNLEQLGKKVEDWWVDIYPVSRVRAESLDYPTQKPEKLLERIIVSSCPADGVVFDPFCGCGTGVAVAQRLGYEWIGIDLNAFQISLIEKRLKESFHIAPYVDYDEDGCPEDTDSALKLREGHREEISKDILTRLGGYYTGCTGDGGIDGLVFGTDGKEQKKVVISVKSGDNRDPSWVRDLSGAVVSNGAFMGVLVTLRKPTKGMISQSKKEFISYIPPDTQIQERHQKIQIMTFADVYDGIKVNFPRGMHQVIYKPKEVRQ